MKITNFTVLTGLALLIAGCTKTQITEAITADDSFISIPLPEITSSVNFYSYETSSGAVAKYIVVLGSDSKVRTAIDACEVCGGSKGYRQVGIDVVCNNCKRHFSIDSLGTLNKGGGCWPAYLNYEIQGDNVLISKQELENNWRYFV